MHLSCKNYSLLLFYSFNIYTDVKVDKLSNFKPNGNGRRKLKGLIFSNILYNIIFLLNLKNVVLQILSHNSIIKYFCQESTKHQLKFITVMLSGESRRIVAAGGWVEFNRVNGMNIIFIT